MEILFFIIILMIFGFYSYPFVLWLLFIAIYSTIFFDVGVYFWIFFTLFTIFTLNRNFRQNFIIDIFLKYLKNNEIDFKIYNNIYYLNENSFSANFFNTDKTIKLTKEEKDFLDNQIEELFIFDNDKLNDEFLAFFKNKNFLDLAIPKQYGGLGFSFFSYLKVIEKIAFHSSSLKINEIIINSLNATTIILEYGTKKQKDYYLPKIAKKEEVIEFIFTKTNIKGEVFKDTNKNLKIKIEFSFEDYSISSMTTLVMIAFNLNDCEHLITENKNKNITFALINKQDIKNQNSSEYLIIDERDIIKSSSFNKDTNLFINSLIFNKNLSFLSLCIGQSKTISKVINSYTNLKNELGIRKKDSKEIEKKIVQNISFTYLLSNLKDNILSKNKNNSDIDFFNHIINFSISKNFKEIANNSIDILNNCKFKKIKKRVYEFIDYSNSLNRNNFEFEYILIKNKSIVIIDEILLEYISSSINVNIKSFIFFLTRGYFIKVDKGFKKYKKNLIWASTNFTALLKFSSLLNKKKTTLINEKLIDIFSWIDLLKLIIKEYENEPSSNYKFLVDYICQYGFYQIQKIKETIFQEIPTLKILLPFIRLNPYALKPNNKINTKIIKFINNGKNLDEICNSKAFLKDNKTILFQLEEALKLQDECKDLEERIIYAINHKTIKKGFFDEVIKEANKTGVITKKEEEKLLFAYEKRLNFFT
ncbi:acyl-CoA dehydrogenase domain-containing protein [Malaciobacter marinus]|uniref:acyl-CoA dehydrogenase domain-containing protein n=1 Tax=Malaciobacter marinus TaxID=505249 RepID=UPI0009A59183|nr:acyl-CoA dehydrogenase domain-containing protein [Malaciobacter marinus]SKB28195.1 acyl-CoA dehydrogenase [Malaciobacter marinus]